MSPRCQTFYVRMLRDDYEKSKQALAKQQEANIRLASLTDMRQDIINGLQSKVAETEKLLDSSREEQNLLKTECSKLKLTLEKINHELNSQTSLVETLTATNKQIQKDFDASLIQLDTKSQILSKANSRIIDQTAQIDTLTETNKQLLSECDNLKAMLEKSKKEYHQQSEELQLKLKHQESTIKSHTAESKRLQMKMEQLKQSLATNNSQYISQNEKLQQKFDQVNEELNKKSAEIVSLKINQDRFEHDNSRLVLQYNQVSLKLTEKEGLIDSLKSKNCKLLSEIEKLQYQSAEEANNLIDELNKTKTIAKQLTEMKSKIDSELVQVQIEITTEKEEATKKYNHMCQQYNQQITGLQDKLVQTTNASNIEVNQLKDLIDKHKEEVKAKQRSVDSLKAEFKKNEYNTNLTISKLNNEKKYLQQRVSEFEPIVQQNIELHTSTTRLNERIEYLSGVLAYYGHYNV